MCRLHLLEEIGVGSPSVSKVKAYEPKPNMSSMLCWSCPTVQVSHPMGLVPVELLLKFAKRRQPVAS